MRKPKYTIDPKEVYTLELEKLQHSFSEIQRVGEEVSELPKVGWRQVEHLRQMNFMILQVVQTGEALLKLP